MDELTFGSECHQAAINCDLVQTDQHYVTSREEASMHRVYQRGLSLEGLIRVRNKSSL